MKWFNKSRWPVPFVKKIIHLTLELLLLISFKISMISVSNTTANKQTSKLTSRKSVMANTVSVDEYFDELISQVHKDYENL